MFGCLIKEIEMRNIDDLIRIAVAGGGLRLDAKRFTTDNLVRLVVAASGSRASIELTNTSSKTTDDLVRISVAGQGRVIFLDD